MEGDPFTLQLIEVHKGRPIKLQVKVLVPVHDHPNFNFVGKLLGPKGNSLKRLQEATQTRMAILGKGSMRNKEKEEELRKLRDPKHSHLNQELHVDISTFAPASEAYARIAHALSEVKRFLVPDYYDDIRQHQLRELAILNCDKKQGQGPEVGNGAESASPLSSPTSTTPPPPPEPLRILPPSLPSSQLHSPHTAAVVRLSSSSSPGGKGRLTRIPYPPYRHVPSVVNTPYRRVPIYGSMDSDPPALIIPDHPDSAYDDGYPEDFYDPLYDNDFPLLGDGKDSEFPGPVAAVPPDRSYEHSFYPETWNPTPSNIRRLKAFTLRTLPRTAYRNKPYPLPPCH